MFRFALWLGADRSEAQDITSETFVRAWAGSGDLRMNTVKAYLMAIARNLFLQRLRRSRRHAELDPELPDPASGPERQAERRDELHAVLRRLQQLPEADRAALIMHAGLEMPYEEIARVLGRSLSAVKVGIHRTRIRLARIRHQEGDEP